MRIDQNSSLILFDLFGSFRLCQNGSFLDAEVFADNFRKLLIPSHLVVFFEFGILSVGGKMLGVSDPVRKEDWDGSP